MPTIEQSLSSQLDTSGLIKVNPVDLPTQTPVIHAAQNNSVTNPFIRCPVPPVRIPSVDNLQLYNRAGYAPQFRIFGA